MVEIHNDDHSPDPAEVRLRRTILRKSLRRAKAERHGPDNPLAWVATFGVVGWTIVVPTVLGLVAGRYIDGRTDSDLSFTITLLVLGAFIGVVAAWQWISGTSRGRGS